MKRFFIWLLSKLTGVEKQKLLSAPIQTRLDGLTVGVFVREPNGSRTNLEKSLKNELACRGATVSQVIQHDVMRLVKEGIPFDTGIDLLIIGTLVIEKFTRNLTELEKYQFERAGFYTENRVYVTAIDHSLSFEGVDKYSNTVFAGTAVSGYSINSGVSIKKSQRLILDDLTKKVISTLDESNIWGKVFVGV